MKVCFVLPDLTPSGGVAVASAHARGLGRATLQGGQRGGGSRPGRDAEERRGDVGPKCEAVAGGPPVNDGTS